MVFVRRVYIKNDKDHPVLYESIHSVDPFYTNSSWFDSEQTAQGKQTLSRKADWEPSKTRHRNNIKTKPERDT